MRVMPIGLLNSRYGPRVIGHRSKNSMPLLVSRAFTQRFISSFQRVEN